MKNFIEVLDDRTLEEKIEENWNKNKKYLIPFVLLLIGVVYAIGEYRDSEISNQKQQHIYSDEMIKSKELNKEKFDNLNEYYKIRTLSGLSKSLLGKDNLIKEASAIETNDSILADTALELKVNLLVDSSQDEKAIKLLMDHEGKTSFQWMLLGDLKLMAFKYDEAKGYYEKARSLAKTQNFLNMLEIKIQHANQAMTGVK